MFKPQSGRDLCRSISLWCGLLPAVLCGCGASGEGSVDRARVSVSGTAEFEGQPIPSGAVVFTHLESGTAVSCPIQGGKYANEGEALPVGGDNSVSVIGLDKEDGKHLWNGTWSKPVKVVGPKFQENFNVLSSQVKSFVDKRQEADAEEEKPVWQQQ